MNLTPDQLRLKQNAAAMIAFADGKPIQGRLISDTDREQWEDYKHSNWCFGSHEYRPKPEPTVRPWSKPDDVPGPVCWVRFANGDRGAAMVISIDSAGARTIYGHSVWNDMIGWEHSIDQKTWLPCVVTEEPK